MKKINPKDVNTDLFIKSAMKGFDKNNLNRILCFFSDNAKIEFEKGKKNRENGQFIVVEKLTSSEFEKGKDQIIHFFIGHNPDEAKDSPLDISIQNQLKALVENPEEWCESGGFGIDLIIFNPDEYYSVNNEFWQYCKAVSSGM